MRQLIVLNYPNYIDDFRKHLIADYNTKKQKMLVAQSGPKFANYKPVFGDKYFGKDDCFIFNKGDVSVSQISNLLFRQGYIIDDIGLTGAITSNKLILFDFLKRFSFEVPEMYVGLDPQQTYGVKFDYEGRVQLCDPQDGMTDYGMFPVSKPELTGTLFYYFLGKKVATSVFIQTPDRTILKSTIPNTKYSTLLNNKIAQGLCQAREAEPVEKERIDNVKLFDKDFVSTVDAIPSLMNATSCQITVMWNELKPLIINVQQTHNPLAIDAMGYDSFLTKVKERFYEVMTNHEEEE